MMNRIAVLAATFLCGLTAPMWPAPADAVAAPFSATPVPVSAPATVCAPCPAEAFAPVAAEVAGRVAAISRGANTGFALYDRKTGQVSASYEPERPFYTASVVKLLIAIDEVHDDRTGAWAAPDAAVRAELTDMLAGSNDGIASAFWIRNGGAAIVTRTARMIGLAHTTPPAIAGQWGMTRTTALDVVAVYRFLEDAMPDTAARPILDALGEARNPADDGWDQYFGIPDGLPDASWRIKQGWMILPRALVLNTTGVVDDRYVVALLTEQARVPARVGRAAVTEGIKALAPLLD